MKQVEKIWAELSAKAQEVETPQESTELSEEVKVELGIMQDVSNAMNDVKQKRQVFDNSSDKWYSELFKIRDKFSSVEVDYKGYKSSLDDLKKYIKEMESMAKELGINPNSFDNYNESKALLNTSEDFDDVYKEAKKLESRIG